MAWNHATLKIKAVEVVKVVTAEVIEREGVVVVVVVGSMKDSKAKSGKPRLVISEPAEGGGWQREDGM